jgi:hypothetical protein
MQAKWDYLSYPLNVSFSDFFFLNWGVITSGRFQNSYKDTKIYMSIRVCQNFFLVFFGVFGFCEGLRDGTSYSLSCWCYSSFLFNLFSDLVSHWCSDYIRDHKIMHHMYSWLWWVILIFSVCFSFSQIKFPLFFKYLWLCS